MGYPKALLEYRGRTFLESILDATIAAGVKRRYVVVGPDTGKILHNMDLRDSTVVETEDFSAGPIGSIRAAIHHAEAHPVDGLLVWPVDMPHVSIGTVEDLVDAFRQSHQPIVVPTYKGDRGHPVIFGREVFQELLDAPDDLGAKAVVRADSSRVQVVEVDDPAVVEDLNTPEAYIEMVKKADGTRG